MMVFKRDYVYWFGIPHYRLVLPLRLAATNTKAKLNDRAKLNNKSCVIENWLVIEKLLFLVDFRLL